MKIIIALAGLVILSGCASTSALTSQAIMEKRIWGSEGPPESAKETPAPTTTPETSTLKGGAGISGGTGLYIPRYSYYPYSYTPRIYPRYIPYTYVPRTYVPRYIPRTYIPRYYTPRYNRYRKF